MVSEFTLGYPAHFSLTHYIHSRQHTFAQAVSPTASISFALFNCSSPADLSHSHSTCLHLIMPPGIIFSQVFALKCSCTALRSSIMLGVDKRFNKGLLNQNEVGYIWKRPLAES